MAIEPAPDVEAALQQVSERWRSGDADGVIATMASDDRLMMAGPGGAIVGREAIASFMRQMVPLSAQPGGGHVHYDRVTALREGDVGWAYLEGRLLLPGQPEISWNAHAVMRREGDGWKWVMFNAGPAGALPAATSTGARQSDDG
jgi:uncharacterized protein (TIGR02246 family)